MAEAARAHDLRVGGREGLRDWYTPRAISTLPMHLARIVCQRQNCRWDAKLRRRFAQLLAFALIVLVGLGIVLAAALDLSVRQWLLYITAPLLPLYELGWSEVRAQNSAAARVEDIKEQLTELWRDALRGLPAAVCAERSRDFQDSIFEHRAGTQPVPDRLYEWLREEMNEHTTDGAMEMITQAEEAMHHGKDSVSADAPAPEPGQAKR